MNTKIERFIHNSDLNIPKEKRAVLTYSSRWLAFCDLREAEDGLAFIFDTKDMMEAKAINESPLEDQLRFLYNCGELLGISKEYEFSLDINNLIIDINFVPKILNRDGKVSEGIDFILKYKALIGCVLLPKYSYEDYLVGGKDLYTKDKLLDKINNLETVGEIKDALIEEYKETVEEKNTTKQLVSKNSVLVKAIALPILSIALIVTGLFLYQDRANNIPYRDSVIAASNAYVAGEPLLVQYILKDYHVDELTHETKYILARSYVVTEALTDTQIEEVLIGLTLRTDTQMFDYWIHLGRLEFEKAIDIAERFNDNELLLFAYLKYEAVVEYDITIGGDDRRDLINRIESAIDRLRGDREEALEYLDELEDIDELDQD